jgi:pimeloyl-ACP methyl ester carboxylesterase
MNRRDFIERTMYLSIVSAVSTKTAAQPPGDAASARYRTLQAEALMSRQLDYSERYAEIPSLQLRAHVVESGRGNPLLMIHGGNGVGAHWLPLMTRLSGNRLVVPDRPGCGLTDGFLYDGVDLRTHAVAFVEGVLDALAIQEASVIGNSMGGYFALCFALAHPNRVRKLILAGGPAGSAGYGDNYQPLPAEAIEARVKGSRLPGRARFERLVADTSRVPDDLVELLDASAAIPGTEESWRSIVRSARPEFTTFALHTELERLSTPTLLIWGEQDRVDPPQPTAIAIANRIPNARLVLLPDAGHAPWLDKPDDCATLVSAFLAEA